MTEFWRAGLRAHIRRDEFLALRIQKLILHTLCIYIGYGLNGHGIWIWPEKNPGCWDWRSVLNLYAGSQYEVIQKPGGAM